MIKFTSGDILRADAEAIVNTVNCVGVMGRGIALQFKKAWPDNFKDYAAACKQNEVKPGSMFIVETGQLANPKYIINFPTKRHWRGASKIEDVELGLNALSRDIKELGIKSIAIPPLGSGLGGLDWGDVRQVIEATLSDLGDVEILVYEPNGAPENDKMAQNRKVPKMTAGRAVLIELMQRYLCGLLDPTVTLLEVHKLLYFMQSSGEPLRLDYQKASYGPYAQNLRHVLNAIEGHFVSGYADGGDAPGKELKLVPGAVDEAAAFLKQHPDSLARFEKVVELVEGFESPFGLELLASVHWVLEKEHAQGPADVVQKIHSWNDRKKQFTQRQISLAIQTLSAKNWLGMASSFPS
ncbi:appr-1-p processing domain-containing protein [gamma proteobacterium BDW918]|jgi:O-acetyl-ADP-ribose deacetylase (regulator of RNase III)|uniref:Appr-1-p processing protein n=1 Tax=Zhongshania aliphaticivorans TaxID=1470434 RepID=A0A127MA55_9GAMM|nr:macro domain-containing protein [Zhongshania aliphaticivorans]AMO70065.1 Appr-1-p processing protein [Zhongshania aliphaticivorans]EIF41748.1 appr-1-p processing domain-containing protein [gamma proteobacterium BDW918]|tara:strand:- start:14295 stop:15353 length:1059 start_codon:yes stop_codon:yes gene_type:complete